jgi:hypothetical protein
MQAWVRRSPLTASKGLFWCAVLCRMSFLTQPPVIGDGPRKTAKPSTSKFARNNNIDRSTYLINLLICLFILIDRSIDQMSWDDLSGLRSTQAVSRRLHKTGVDLGAGAGAVSRTLELARDRSRWLELSWYRWSRLESAGAISNKLEINK